MPASASSSNVAARSDDIDPPTARIEAKVWQATTNNCKDTVWLS